MPDQFTLWDKHGNKVGSATRRGPSSVNGGYTVWDKHDRKVGEMIPRGPSGGSSGEGAMAAILLLTLVIAALIVVPVVISFIYPYFTSIPALLRDKENRKEFGLSLLLTLWVVILAFFVFGPMLIGQYSYTDQKFYTGFPALYAYYSNQFTGGGDGPIIGTAGVTLTLLSTALLGWASLTHDFLKPALRGAGAFHASYWKGWVHYWPSLWGWITRKNRSDKNTTYPEINQRVGIKGKHT